MHTGQSTFSHASGSKNCYVVLSVLEERDLSDKRNLQECSRTIAIPSSRQPYIPLVASSRRHFTTGYLPSFASLQNVCGSSTATSSRRALQLGNLEESPTTSLTFSLCSFFLCSPLLLLLSQACLCLARTLSAAKHCQGEPASSFLFLFLFLFPRSWLLLSLGGNSPLRTYSRRAASDTETSLCARASNEGAVTVCGNWNWMPQTRGDARTGRARRGWWVAEGSWEGQWLLRVEDYGRAYAEAAVAYN